MKFKVITTGIIATCAFSALFSCQTEYRYHPDGNDISEYHSYSRKPFLHSLDETYRGNDPEKIKYWVMHYLLEERSTMPEADSVDLEMYSQLENLDIGRDRDSVDAIFRIAFRNLDLEPGPPNDFIEEEIPRRVQFIVDHRCFHAGQLYPFDQLARDVIRIGVPDLESFGDSSGAKIIDVYFPQLGLPRHYLWNPLDFYYAGAPLVEAFDDKNPGKTKLMPDPRYLRGGRTISQQDMETIKDKIYQCTPYAQLKNVVIRPFLIPTPKEYDFIDPLEYFRLAWFSYRVGLDIFSEIESEKNGLSDTLNLSIKYVLYNPFTDEIVDSSSTEIIRSLSDAASGTLLNFREFTKVFHTRTSLKPNREDHFILDVDVRSREPDGLTKKAASSFIYSLPKDIIQIPRYDIMLLSGDQIKTNSDAVPLSRIPIFAPEKAACHNDSIRLWVPVTDLKYSPKDDLYSGIIDIYLTRSTETNGTARIVKESIRFSPRDDTLSAPIDIESRQAEPVTGPAPIFTDTINSRTPNIFYVTTLPIPEKIKKADDYTLLAFVYCQGRADHEAELIATASCDIRIK